MGMAINQAGQNDATLAIDLPKFASTLFEPGMTQDFLLPSGRDDLATAAEHSRIFDESDFSKSRATSRTTSTTQGEKLANVGQE
jgi:hypothetical protein